MRWSDSVSARPVAALVFVASLVGFGALVGARGGQAIQATAVAHSPSVLVETLLVTTVAQVHVKPGQRVQPGDLLLTLSATHVERERETVAREISALEAQLAFERLEAGVQTDRLALQVDALEQADARQLEVATSRRNSASQQLAAAQRWRANVAQLVAQGLESKTALLEADQRISAATAERDMWTGQARAARVRADRPTLTTFDAAALSAAQARLTQARLQQLRARKRHLDEDHSRLTVRAPISGRVAQIATAGARTEAVPTLAEIVPDDAHELIAFLPADAPAGALPTPESTASVAGCAHPARVARVGGSVAQAPGQVQRMGLPGAVWGLPVYLEIPQDCRLIPGTLLHVEIHR